MTRGLVHHIEINVSHLETSIRFWGWFLEKLGYAPYQEWDQGKSWRIGETYIVLVQTREKYLDVPYHRCRSGLNHLAFHAESRQDVDEMTNALRDRGVPILYADRHPFAGEKDYYAVYFEDPDRIKVEFAAPPLKNRKRAEKDVRIRDYRQEDEEGWLRCRVLSFLHTAYFDNVLQSKETYRHASIELVAEQSGKIVGLIDVEVEDAPKSVCALCSSCGGMIWNLAVHPDFQRLGIGARLLSEAESRLKIHGIDQLEAWTRDDPWVNKWYLKNGFKEIRSYLHVCMEGDEVHRTVRSTVPGIRPLGVFAHYMGDHPEKIKTDFRRVHECRGYYKSLKDSYKILS